MDDWLFELIVSEREISEDLWGVIHFMKSTQRLYRFLLISLLLFSTLFFVASCESSEQMPSSSTTTRNDTIDEIYYPSDYVSRTEWNIELSVVETREAWGALWIIIQIRDNDNIGFLLNDSYILERQEGESWIPIVAHSQEKLTSYTGYCPPAEERNYNTTNTKIIHPEQAGHYRVTKYLSDHKVTLEFDITE